jgi:hypothetical protein
VTWKSPFGLSSLVPFLPLFFTIYILSFSFFPYLISVFFPWAIMIDSQRGNADRLGSGNQIRNGAWVGVWRIQSSPHAWTELYHFFVSMTFSLILIAIVDSYHHITIHIDTVSQAIVHMSC